MPIPKPGTQHHALGHGRVPTSGVTYGAGGYTASGIRSASAVMSVSVSSSMSTSSGYGASRYASSGYTGGHGGLAKKASRARRESFKPRPSMDTVEAGVGVGSRYGGFASSLKEEDEGY